MKNGCPYRRLATEILTEIKETRGLILGGATLKRTQLPNGRSYANIRTTLDSLENLEVQDNCLRRGQLLYREFSEMGRFSMVGIQILIFILKQEGLLANGKLPEISQISDATKKDAISLWIAALHSPDSIFSTLIENAKRMEDFEEAIHSITIILLKLASEPTPVEKAFAKMVVINQEDIINSDWRAIIKMVIDDLVNIGFKFGECPALRNGLIKLLIEKIIPIYRQALEKRLSSPFVRLPLLMAGLQRKVIDYSL